MASDFLSATTITSDSDTNSAIIDYYTDSDDASTDDIIFDTNNSTDVTTNTNNSYVTTDDTNTSYMDIDYVEPLKLETKTIDDNNTFGAISRIEDIIQIHGIKSTLDIIEPIYIIYTAERFFLPQKKKIQIYVKAFRKLLLYYKGIINSIFKIDRILPQESQNGKVFILKLDKASDDVPKLLIKVPLTNMSDPISYEYYVGLTLNKLREEGITHFSLVYGRFKCGINPNLSTQLCDNTFADSTHILYEYISVNKGKTQSFSSYITDILKSNSKQGQINILKLIFMLMWSLQHAQDKYDFTHYDLHLNNILILTLDKESEFNFQYNDKMYTFDCNCVPYIIDYGRAHINPDVAISDNNANTFIDTDTNKTFFKFKEYQEDVWKDTSFYIAKGSRTMESVVEYIEYITNNVKFMSYLREKGVDNIERYYLNESTGKITHGIDPKVKHNVYDMYRCVRSVCAKVLNFNDSDTLEFWKDLDFGLQMAYPFYIPIYYTLPTNYKSLSGYFETPIEIAELIFEFLDTRMDYSPILQTGAGTKNENKFKKKTKMNNDTQEIFQTLKTKRTMLTNNDPYKLKEEIKIDYSQVVHDTPLDESKLNN